MDSVLNYPPIKDFQLQDQFSFSNPNAKEFLISRAFKEWDAEGAELSSPHQGPVLAPDSRELLVKYLP